MYKQLKDIAEVRIGYSLREGIISDVNGNVYLLTPKDVSATEGLLLEGATKINLSNPGKHYIHDKEILFVSRGRFSAIIFNAPSESGFVASSGFHRIKVTSDVVIPEYIMLFINSKEGQKALESRQETMTVPAITVSQLKEVPIPLISLEEQQKLISLTSTFSSWKTLRQRQEELQSTLINQAISKITGAKNG